MIVTLRPGGAPDPLGACSEMVQVPEGVGCQVGTTIPPLAQNFGGGLWAHFLRGEGLVRGFSSPDSVCLLVSAGDGLEE